MKVATILKSKGSRVVTMRRRFVPMWLFRLVTKNTQLTFSVWVSAAEGTTARAHITGAQTTEQP